MISVYKQIQLKIFSLSAIFQSINIYVFLYCYTIKIYSLGKLYTLSNSYCVDITRFFNTLKKFNFQNFSNHLKLFVYIVVKSKTLALCCKFGGLM